MSLEIVEWAGQTDNALAVCSEKNNHESGNANFAESAMTIGVFDGVHLGHQELIRKIVQRGPNPTIVTFRENPKKHVSRSTFEGDLYSLKQKLTVFERLGVCRVLLIDFSENFSKLSGRDFLDLLTSRGKMVYLAIGKNFRCGWRKDTDAAVIEEINRLKGIPTEVIAPVVLPPAYGAGPVSSSRIRSAIFSGDLKLAAALIGRNFDLDLSDITPVESGCCLSPTADTGVDREKLKNLVFDPGTVNRIIPGNGRYNVLLYPGRRECQADIEGGKVFLRELPALTRAESLEFIIN